MPEGAAVIRYAGKRRTVWRIKFRDADGRQVQETLGRRRPSACFRARCSSRAAFRSSRSRVRELIERGRAVVLPVTEMVAALGVTRQAIYALTSERRSDA